MSYSEYFLSDDFIYLFLTASPEFKSLNWALQLRCKIDLINGFRFSVMI